VDSMSAWLDGQERKRATKRRPSAAQLALFTPLPRFEPPLCACGADSCIGDGVFLRRGREGNWKCYACASAAGWIPEVRRRLVFTGN
jgi:hypothetical protein